MISILTNNKYLLVAVMVLIGLTLGTLSSVIPIQTFLIIVMLLVAIAIIKKPIIGVFALISLMPFHSVITYYFPGLFFWKELLMVTLFLILIANYVSSYDHGIRSLKYFDKKSLISTVYVLLFCYLIWVLVAYLFMDHKNTLGIYGIRELIIFGPITFFVFSSFIKKQSQYIKLMWIYIVSSFILSILGIIEALFFSETGWFFAEKKFYANDVYRVGSTMGYLTFPSYVAVILPIILSFLIGLNSIKAKIVLVTIFLTDVMALLLTLSRGPWVQALIGIVFVLGCYMVIKKKMRIRIVLFYNVLLFFVLISASWLYQITLNLLPNLTQRMSSIFDWSTNYSNVLRKYFWEQSLQKGLESPIIGFGPGTSGSITRDILGAFGVTESQILKLFVDTGIVGMLLFYGIWCSVIVIGFLLTNHYVNKNHDTDFILLIGAVGALLGLFAEAAVLQVLEGFQISVSFWLLCSMILFIYSNNYNIKF